MTTGEKIRYFRKQRGFTLAKLSELTGLHHVTIRKYEANMMTPRLPQMKNLASALCVSFHDLLESEPSDYSASEKLMQLQKELDAYRRLGTVEELAALIKDKDESRIEL